MHNQLNGVSTTKDSYGNTISWTHHPMFDYDRSANLIGTIQVPDTNGSVTVEISEKFYRSLLNAQLDPDRKHDLTVNSDQNQFKVVGMRVNRDFFETYYQADLQRTTDIGEVSPITDLNISLMSYSFGSYGVYVKDPVNIMNIIPSNYGNTNTE
jgi:hypothetical protein